MPPHDPYGPPPTPTPESYDFIRQYGSKSSNSTFSNMPSTSRIVIVVIGAVLLLALAFGFIQLISRPSDPAQLLLVGIAQQESEIARVAKEAGQSATEQPTLNFAITVQYSITSDQASLLTLMKASGSAPSSQSLASGKNKATDAQLTNAKDNGTYDQTYISIAQSQLKDYEQKLQQAYSVAGSAKEKLWVQAAYKNAQLLTQMSTQTE